MHSKHVLVASWFTRYRLAPVTTGRPMPFPSPQAPSRPGGVVSQRWPGGHRPLLQPSAGQIHPSPAKTLTPRFAAKEASRSHVASLTHVSHGLVAWPEGPTRLEGPGDYSSPTPLFALTPGTTPSRDGLRPYTRETRPTRPLPGRRGPQVPLPPYPRAPTTAIAPRPARLGPLPSTGGSRDTGRAGSGRRRGSV